MIPRWKPWGRLLGRFGSRGSVISIELWKGNIFISQNQFKEEMILRRRDIPGVYILIIKTD